ncbi:MAG: hypothetical protein E4H13_00780 [Calditrichales bacterium]|nr:MAG: hypothetical protein E4H13_00780 [Calditrichales bacterium]
MNAHIGLAFSVENICFSVFLRDNDLLLLERVGCVQYPFPYDEEKLINTGNIAALADLIQKKVLAGVENISDLSISIESNMAVLKRIALPDNFNQFEEDEHIAWDLSQSLLEPVDNYTYFKTDNIFETEALKDHLTIAIQKNIVTFLRDLSKKLGIELANISVNPLVAEITLKNVLENHGEGLIALFKIGSTRVESTYLWNGNYYISHYDKIPTENQAAPGNDYLHAVIKAKIKQMESLFEQFTQTRINTSRIFVYGNNIEDRFLQKLQENLSVVAFRLNPLQNIEKSEYLQNHLPSIEEATKFVEAIGVVLDQ